MPCTRPCSPTPDGPPTTPASSTSTRPPAPSSPTGTAPPTISPPCCAPRSAATPTTRNSLNSSVSCPPAARTSVPAGPPTTCVSTAPGTRNCTTPSSATSTSTSRPWNCRPSPASHCSSTPHRRAAPPRTASTSSRAGQQPPNKPVNLPAARSQAGKSGGLGPSSTSQRPGPPATPPPGLPDPQPAFPDQLTDEEHHDGAPADCRDGQDTRREFHR